MSFLNTTHTTSTILPLPPQTTKAQALTFLHSHEKVISLNPNLIKYTLHPPSSPTASHFYPSEPAEFRPPAGSPAPVYEITEREGGKSGKENEEGSWRGGWAKRFVPDTIVYNMGFSDNEDGMVSITHAPLGVWSRTTWVIREAKEGEMGADGQGKGLLVDEKGEVRSNRMLMGFIKTTLKESHDRLVKDFVEALREGNGPNGAHEQGKTEEGVQNGVASP